MFRMTVKVQQHLHVEVVENSAAAASGFRQFDNLSSIAQSQSRGRQQTGGGIFLAVRIGGYGLAHHQEARVVSARPSSLVQAQVSPSRVCCSLAAGTY
ncbi:unnamed protein product [Sphagnum balticum]